MSILSTKELTKNFGGLVAVDHVTFEVDAGTVCGLIGPNGSGKSTLINLLTGFYDPDSGSVMVNGEDVTHEPTHIHVRKGIARTFQHTRIFDTLSVRENVFSGMVYQAGTNLMQRLVFTPKSRKDYEARLKKADEILKFMEMDHLADERAGRIPHGEQRFLEIARALATDPDVMLIDEPAAGMTKAEIERLKNLILKLKQAGKAVIVIEHNTGFVKDVSDKIIVLNFGKKIAEGDPSEIHKNKEVIAAYLGGGRFAKS